MKYDKPLLAILIGMLAVFPFEGLTLITEQLGWNSSCVFDANSMIFSEAPSRLVGALTTPLTGGLSAAIIYYMTRFTGTDYLWLKGAFVGAVIQGGLKTSSTSYMEQSPAGNIVFALGAAMTGAIIGFFINKYLLQPNRSF